MSSINPKPTCWYSYSPLGHAQQVDILDLKKQCLESSEHTKQVAHTTYLFSLNDTYWYSQDTAHAFTFDVSETVNINFNSHH